jgi:hypothetical protein
MVAPASHYQLDTPPADQRLASLAEIEIVDPTHPLFGRRFPLLHTSTTLTGPGFAWVLYRGYMQLRVPLSVTNLSATAAPAVRTQLTPEAMQDLLALAGQCGLFYVRPRPTPLEPFVRRAPRRNQRRLRRGLPGDPE